jgi:hypothetical protein
MPGTEIRSGLLSRRLDGQIFLSEDPQAQLGTSAGIDFLQAGKPQTSSLAQPTIRAISQFVYSA